jgi:hypothetical protein
MSTGYEPLNTPKPVADGLWLIDGPAAPDSRLPLPTRASVVRLAGGALWVHAPTAMNESLCAELVALGPVAWLVCPTPHLSAWQQAFPQAAVWQGGDAPWQDEIAAVEIAGSRKAQERAFFHHASRTLILDRLIVNIETAKLPTWARPFIWFAGTDDPNGALPPDLRRAYRDRDALAESIEGLIALRPRRILLSQGRWYSENAVGELERAFRKVLRDRMWMKAVEQIKAKEADTRRG